MCPSKVVVSVAWRSGGSLLSPRVQVAEHRFRSYPTALWSVACAWCFGLYNGWPSNVSLVSFSVFILGPYVLT